MRNQAPPITEANFAEDPALLAGLRAAGAVPAAVTSFGAEFGTDEALRWGHDANRFPPELVTHDPTGERIDRVDFHPAWHRLMEASVRHRLHTGPWSGDGDHGHLTRTAQLFVATQTEAGHTCPISMTYAVVPAISHQPEVAGRWMGKLLSNVYDPSYRPAEEKAGVLFGMGMTERQGGSDVRSNVTTAAPAPGGPGGRYVVNGHKWFCSAPMNDAFLVLAQAPGGLSCLALPRWRDDGTRNGFHIQRLKSKLGNRSNASSEVEFVDAEAWLIGEEGAGLSVILEMVNHTRLDCVTGSTGLMRQAVHQAVHNARHRSTFGKLLIEHPLMRNVLSDLVLETEAAMAVMMRLASLYDDPTAGALRRIATPIAKFWVCKRTPETVAEALECLGGNGYVEESPLPRIYRESPLNSIWEGSGNVICLDVVRAISRSPDSVTAFSAELERGRGRDARLDDAIDDALRSLAHPEDPEGGARRLVGRLAVTWQAVLLTSGGEAMEPAAAAYLDHRLPLPGGPFGSLAGSHFGLVDRMPDYS